MIKIKYITPRLPRIDAENYVKALNDILCKNIGGFGKVHIETPATLKQSILFLAGFLGYISTEMFTGIFSNANLPSIRTKINELINEGFLGVVKSSTVERYSDSLVNSIYFATKKGVRKLEENYSNCRFVSKGEKQKVALHDYFNAHVVLAAVFSGAHFDIYVEYKDGIRMQTNVYGRPYYADNLRIDTVLVSSNDACFVETDTGTETINDLLHKITNYYNHMDSLGRSFGSNRGIIIFAVRKSRKTVAKEPRYKPSMLGVLRSFLFTEYAIKRFDLFKELDGRALNTVEITEADRQICRTVVRDLINHSPLDFNEFRISDFHEYTSQVYHQTSEVYQEDIARCHDHLAEARMNSMFEYFLRYFKYPNCDRLPYEFRDFLGGRECFFISVPRFSALLPFIFIDKRLIRNNTKSVREIFEECFSKEYGDLRDAKKRNIAYVNVNNIKECDGMFLSSISFRNMYLVEKNGYRRMICIENIEYDMGARIRLYYAVRCLSPVDYDLVIVLLVKDKTSMRKLDMEYGFSKSGSKHIEYRYFVISEITNQNEPELYSL